MLSSWMFKFVTKKKKTVQFYEKPTSQDQLASLAYILIKQTNTIYKPFHNSQL